MRKTLPFLRLIRLVQFVREKNRLQQSVGHQEMISFVKKITDDASMVYSTATFARDKKKIREELGIDLKFDKVQGYFIDPSDQVGLIESALDYYEVFSILSHANALPEMFILSERKPLGLDQIGEVVDWIKNKEVIQFNYFKYDTGKNEIRQIEPLAIKESRERWYLIGNDHQSNAGLRAFGFDRISNVTVLGMKFTPQFTMEDIQQKYFSLFAMFDAEDQEVEQVVLEFNERDGNYIQSFPLHHSQQVEAIENGVRVHLRLKTTPDFIMEIMSRAWSLKVVRPVSLRQTIAKIMEEALHRNQ